MDNIKFDERVKNAIISYAQKYKYYYTDYEYLILSQAFNSKKFYIISAKEDNFLHLTGVNSPLSPQEFFTKSFNGTLSTNDFDFHKKGQSEKEVKGSVRRKIQVMDNTIGIFDKEAPNVKVEENFTKNAIRCSFAAGNSSFTIGFSISDNVRPKTLLKGSELNNTNALSIDAVLRRKSGDSTFDTLLYGSKEVCNKYKDIITNNSTQELIDNLFSESTYTDLAMETNLFADIVTNK